MPDFRDVLRSISGPLKPDALLRVARFLTAGQVNVAEGEMEPGLVQLADGTVWLVNPDGSLTKVGGGGSMPIQSPLDIPGCALYLDASQLDGLSDGDPVDTWPDLSGNGFDAVAGANCIWALDLTDASSGHFTLSSASDTTGNLQWNVAAADLQAALEALSDIGAGNVQVSILDGAPQVYVIEFVGALAVTDVALTFDAGTLDAGNGLTAVQVGGATSPTYKIAVQNSLAVVRFEQPGTPNQWLRLPESFVEALGGATGITVASVWTLDPTQQLTLPLLNLLQNYYNMPRVDSRLLVGTTWFTAVTATSGSTYLKDLLNGFRLLHYYNTSSDNSVKIKLDSAFTAALLGCAAIGGSGASDVDAVSTQYGSIPVPLHLTSIGWTDFENMVGGIEAPTITGVQATNDGVPFALDTITDGLAFLGDDGTESGMACDLCALAVWPRALSARERRELSELLSETWATL